MKMQQDVLCRGCLAVEGQFSYLHDFETAQAYERLIGYSVSPTDGYPQHLCSYCQYSLLKFAEFRARCLRVMAALAPAVGRGNVITKKLTTTLNVDLKPLFVQTETVTLDIGGFDCAEPDLGGFDCAEPDLGGFDCAEPDLGGFDRAEPDLGGFDCAEPEEVLMIDPNDDWDVSDLKHETQDLLTCRDDINTPSEVFIPGATSGLDNEHKIKEEEPPVVNNTETKVQNKSKVKVKKKDRKPKRINTLKAQNSNQTVRDHAKKAGFYIRFLSLTEQMKEVEEKRNETVTDGHNCRQCGKHFKDTSALERHSKTYHLIKPNSFVCDICGCAFNRKKTLKSHMENHSWVFSCQKCEFKTNHQWTLMAHRSYHEGKRFECKYCDKVYNKKTTFQNHVRLLHASEWCRLCGEFFVGEFGVVRHLKLIHDVGEEFPFACDDCDKRFKSDTALERHRTVRGCGQAGCPQCGEAFAVESLLKYHLVQRHFPDAEPEGFDCTQCSIRFHNATARDSHSCGDPCCAQCGASFPDAKAMADHVYVEHEIFKCEQCGQRFTNSGYFKKHYSLAHARSADSQQKVIKGKCYKPRPRRAKSGQVSWRAGCGGDVQRAGDAGGGGVTGGGGKLVCEVCGKGFPTSARLTSHQLTHSGRTLFSCRYCQKGFKQKCNLQTHERTHTGERPYSCASCDKTFRTSAAMYRHVMIHTGVRRHVCEICGKSFQQSTYVKTHIQTAHLQQPWPARNRNRKDKSEDTVAGLPTD